ncbi:nodulation protein NodH [Aestuariivita boseongensis]|uniref:nodulation protein NodH n=1 Tax=Aestuariivita boseongensis TaxID=1470562 RepID=UPI00067FAC0F|nr:nodulation protein NodH [Aestuariivita boseongensis]
MARFEYFVVLAEMRTGSNFLETNLNSFDGVTCHGEAFNPHFIGYPTQDALLGLTRAERDSDPMRLLSLIKRQPGELGGFRYFHDHDPRVLDFLLDDPACAKIILTRNPLDSYVSWKIAQATGQWKLTNVQKRKAAKAQFDADEFAAHVEALQSFQVTVLNRLQITGQTPFYVAYEDLQSVDVMNGLAQWLGIDARLEGLSKNLKRQNPQPLVEKVANPGQMVEAVGRLDQFNLTRTPNFEPRRGAAVPSYVAAREAPLMYLPVKGGPERQVEAWLASLDGVSRGDLHRKMNQKDLREWMRAHPGHRRFTVLPHPLERAHHAFCTKILSTGLGHFGQLRRSLRKNFDLPIPEEMPDPGYSAADHRKAFSVFLDFVKANLAGQTALRVDAFWCTQSQILQGFSEFALPDLVIRAQDAATDLPALAERLGCAPKPLPDVPSADTPYDLADIYDDALEAQIADVYQRDYIMFGFGPWGQAA